MSLPAGALDDLKLDYSPVLHVSGDVFAHRQEHLTEFTASGNVHQCRYRKL
jgi:hypothetical protein